MPFTLSNQQCQSTENREHRELMLITDSPHPSLNHQMTPDGTDMAPFMLQLWTPVSNNKHYSKQSNNKGLLINRRTTQLSKIQLCDKADKICFCILV